MNLSFHISAQGLAVPTRPALAQQKVPVLNAGKESKFSQSFDVYLKFLLATNRALWAWAADSKDMLKSITLDNAVIAEGKWHP